MYNKNIMKAINLINETCKDPERNQHELEKLINKYQAKTEIIETLSNGIKLFKVLDKDGLVIAEYHDINPVKQWGGQRPGAGRPSTGRKRRQYYTTEREDVKLRQYLEDLREPIDYNKMYCTESDLDTLVREKIADGWKMFAHEHPENGTIIDIVNDIEPPIENVKFFKKYLYKNGRCLGGCIMRFWKPSK